MLAAVEAAPLPKRWYPLRPHATQTALRNCRTRFAVVEASRRSGKTEVAKRFGVLEAAHPRPHASTWFTKYCAPTRDQAKEIYWEDLKALSAPWWRKQPHETSLKIFLTSGAEVSVVGLDKPARFEGSPTSRGFFDELAEYKQDTLDRHILPAMDTEIPGQALARAWFYGVPRPSGQFSRIARLAQLPTEPDWSYFHWDAYSVLSKSTIDAAKRTLDPIMFEQEYLARRVSLEGRIYYSFSTEHNAAALRYDPSLPLILCFDFNRNPGSAVIVQEQQRAGAVVDVCDVCAASNPGQIGAACRACMQQIQPPFATCVIGEVHIPRNSATPNVCGRIVQDYGHHRGDVVVYGDATGGAHKTSSVEGSDWDLVKSYLAKAFPKAKYCIKKANPAERARVNAVNLRCCNAANSRRLFIDPVKAPETLADMEGVMALRGGSGEIDKDSDDSRTHWSDGLGYYIESEFPAGGGGEGGIEAVG